MSKIYRVEMSVPCVEVHVYEVNAESMEEATLIGYTNHSEDWVPNDAKCYHLHHENEEAEARVTEVWGGA